MKILGLSSAWRCRIPFLRTHQPRTNCVAFHYFQFNFAVCRCANGSSTWFWTDTNLHAKFLQPFSTAPGTCLSLWTLTAPNAFKCSLLILILKQFIHFILFFQLFSAILSNCCPNMNSNWSCVCPTWMSGHWRIRWLIVGACWQPSGMAIGHRRRAVARQVFGIFGHKMVSNSLNRCLPFSTAC